MNERICAFVSKAAFALLIVNCVMLFVVERGSAEQVITILSIVMMGALFAMSSAKLRKLSKMDDTSSRDEDKEENRDKE